MANKGVTIALVGCGSVALLGFIIVAAGIIWLVTGPEGGVRLKNEMEDYAIQHLEEHQILQPGESVVAYYDVTISLDGSEAAILSTDRLIYFKNGQTTAIPIDEITDVRHREETLIGHVIEVESETELMKIEIAPLNQGDTFVNALQKAYQKTSQ